MQCSGEYQNLEKFWQNFDRCFMHLDGLFMSCKNYPVLLKDLSDSKKNMKKLRFDFWSQECIIATVLRSCSNLGSGHGAVHHWRATWPSRYFLHRLRGWVMFCWLKWRVTWGFLRRLQRNSSANLTWTWRKSSKRQKHGWRNATCTDTNICNIM